MVAILLYLGFSPVWKIFIFKKDFFFVAYVLYSGADHFNVVSWWTLAPLLFYRKLNIVFIVLHWIVWLGIQEKTKNGDIRVCFEKPTQLLRKSAICLYKFLYQLLGKILMMQLQHFKAFIVHILWFCIMASLISFYLYDSICVCGYVCMYAYYFFIYLLNLQILDALSCCCSSSNKNVNLSYSTLVLK